MIRTVYGCILSLPQNSRYIQSYVRNYWAGRVTHFLTTSEPSEFRSRFASNLLYNYNDVTA